MLKRQAVLLQVIRELEKRGIQSRRAIVKSLFLLKNEYFLDEYISYYAFFPYKQGPFSHLCFSDLRKLNDSGMIDSNETSLTANGISCVNAHSLTFDSQINHLLGRFANEKQMVDYVYAKYPEFTVKSELIDRQTIKKDKGYATIGYEQKNIDEFLNILVQKNINILIDVRNNPFSMNFQFIGAKLKKYLESVDIEYVHIPELGIEGNKRKNLETKKDYTILFSEYRRSLENKKEYLNKIILFGKERKVALMCFEKDQSFCHRGVIAEYLRKNGCKVVDL